MDRGLSQRSTCRDLHQQGQGGLFGIEPRYLNIVTGERAQEEAETVVKPKLPSTLVFRPKKKVVKPAPTQPTGTGTTVVNLGATSILWKNGHANIACDHVGDNDVDILQNILEWDTFTMTQGIIGTQSVQSKCVPTLLDIPLGLGYTFAFITAPSPAGPNSNQLKIAVLDDDSYAEALINDFTLWTVYDFPGGTSTSDSFSAVRDDKQIYFAYRGREGQIFAGWFDVDDNGFPETLESN